MRAVFLVPRRDDEGHRDRLWKWCKARWSRLFPDVAIYEGHHNEGPFNRAAGINRAAELADRDGRWDIGIVIDSDVFIRQSQLRKAIDKARKTGRVTWAHRRWRGLSEDWTARTINPKKPRDFGPEVDYEDMDVLVERTNPYSWSCCIVIPRAVWDDLGGFDERFVGWGFEDMAFQSTVAALYGWERIEGDVYHLHHPRSEERIVKGQPAFTASADYITNARLGRRYMVAARRDYGVHDRPGKADAEELKRDIANLVRDDVKLRAPAQLLGLPDWSGWWPRLEELKDGAKAHREFRARPTVTVVVHTGGSEASWPQRSGYLRRSLASLNEHIQGPIVQRVIYSDWAEHREELEAIATEAGFYVAGEGHHGYTEGMRRMWAYLRKRAKGEYVFATEDDFLYPEPVDLLPLIEVLRDDLHLAQVALLRDSFYQDERETGGILGWPEPAFTKVGMNGTSRLEHRLFFTCNPSVFRKSLTDNPWPQGKHSETLFGARLLRDKRVRFAFWGDRVELTKHIGEVRAGVGY